MKRVVAIPGEDAAPEAFHPTVELVNRLGVELEWVFPAIADARREIDRSDTTLFGATSGPSAPALFHLRWGRGTYANVRPTRWIPGFRSPLSRPDGIDFVIVRENLEDLYVRIEGDVEALAPLGLVSETSRRAVHEMTPGRFALKVITEAGATRVLRFGFELARRRKRAGRPGKVTVGTKHNMLPRTDGWFREIAVTLAREYPDVAFESFIVDDFAHRLVARPHELDVVVLPNLYGDILSDAAAALAGGLGVAASGCYGDDYAYFESAHGTAPDIAGRGIINPTATILSAAMMLEYLEFPEAAARLRSALERTYAAGESLTPDQGGRATTREFCAAVAKEL
jgi:isocitrate/isopropylmalate dehydrogenase